LFFCFQEEVADFYNATECCVSAGMSELCMTLCSYEARTRDFQTLSVVCSPYFHTLLRCGAGGRDHLVRLQNLRRQPLAPATAADPHGSDFTAKSIKAAGAD
jgi:hypothetical protein